ncbi:MAG TPA: glycosyltransferase [Solirubrobacteraceae bacterium]|nr:glycosyltransferase [Solirubrobacteraceae bacterium]
MLLKNEPKKARRIRVAQVGPARASRGGMGAVTRDLAASPLAQRFDFEFVDSWREDTRGARRLLVFLASLARLAAWSLRRGAGVVHVHTAVRGSWYRKAVVVVVAKALGQRAVLQVHSGEGDITDFWARLDPARRALISWAFRRADRVTSVSEAGAAALRRLVGVERVLVVRNAAPAASADGADPVATRPGDVEVLYLGGFANRAKGGQVLVEALPEIARRVGDVRVVLAGPGEPPAAAVPVIDGVAGAHWRGWLDEDAKAAALAAADVVVFPSISEGLPVALLEAMAAGRCIVAARTGGMPEILTDDVDAVLVPAADPDALADAVAAVADDPARRARLSRGALARAARLNRDEVYRPLEQIYVELASRARRAGGAGPGAGERNGSGDTGTSRNGHARGVAARPERGDGEGLPGRGSPSADTPHRRRALLVCSPGGHLQQMLALRPAWQEFDVSWATLTGYDAEHILAGEDVAIAHGPTNRSVLKLLRNLVFADRLIRARRPDVILSTGAGLAVPMFLLGRFHGVRLVYVESLTRTQGLSLSGRLVAPLAHELFVQWPTAVERGARYAGGNILTEGAAQPAAGGTAVEATA